jgi:N-acetyl-gamma-glutamyl-phosphate reductase
MNQTMVRIAILGATGYTAWSRSSSCCGTHARIRCYQRQEGSHTFRQITSLTGQLDHAWKTPVRTSRRQLAVCVSVPAACGIGRSSPELLARGVRVVSRPTTGSMTETYRKWYEHDHPDAERLGKTPYGLPEMFGGIPKAPWPTRVLSTSTIIPLAPLKAGCRADPYRR